MLRRNDWGETEKSDTSYFKGQDKSPNSGSPGFK